MDLQGTLNLRLQVFWQRERQKGLTVIGQKCEARHCAIVLQFAKDAFKRQ
jgi:hypothetical protein